MGVSLKVLVILVAFIRRRWECFLGTTEDMMVTSEKMERVCTPHTDVVNRREKMM